MFNSSAEYDLLSDTFTGKEWKVEGGDREYNMHRRLEVNINEVEEKELPGPIGKFLYSMPL